MRERLYPILFLILFPLTGLLAGQDSILASPMTNAGNGQVTQIRFLLNEVLEAHGLKLEDRLPPTYQLALPRLWRAGESLGQVLGSICLMAGDLDWRLEESQAIFEQTEQVVKPEDLPGRRSLRPSQRGDLIFSIGSSIALDSGIEPKMENSPGYYFGHLTEVNSSLGLDWFFADNFSFGGLILISGARFSFYRENTDEKDFECSAGLTAYALGVRAWLNPQHDLGLLPELEFFGGLEFGLGLFLSLASISYEEHPGLRLHGEDLGDLYFGLLGNLCLSYNFWKGLYLRFDWYFGRIEQILQGKNDLYTIITPSLALRF